MNNLPRIACVSLALVLLASGVRADVVYLGKLPVKNVRITGIEDGVVMFSGPGGQQQKELAALGGLDFERYPDYRKAVQLIEDDPAQAARLLQGVLNALRRDGQFMRPLVRLRLSQAQDAAGQFAPAIENYIQAIQGDASDYFLERAPRNAPADADTLKQAAERVEKARGDTRDADVRQALQNLGTSIGRTLQRTAASANGTAAQTDSDPAEMAPTPRGGQADQAPRTLGARADDQAGAAGAALPAEREAQDTADAARAITAIQSPMDAGRWDQAIEAGQKMVESLSQRGLQDRLPDVYFALAQAHAGKGDHLSAALTYMRIAVTFPNDNLRDAAMLAAGQQLAEAEHYEAARQVLQKLETTATQTQIRREAQTVRSRLPMTAEN